MVVAVDSSILLDILLEDKRFFEASFYGFESIRKSGPIIVSPIVIAEIFPALGSMDVLEQFMRDFSLQFINLGIEASAIAGGIFFNYQRNRGPKKRVIADFLVGAHAIVHADALFTRDSGFYRSYFKDLKII